MKNGIKLFGIIVFVAVIGLSMAGCSVTDSTPETVTYEGEFDGSKYILVITEGARYAAKVGDSYILTVTTSISTKTSSGTVTAVGDTLTLMPSGTTITFTITINSSLGTITQKPETIFYTDGSIITGSGGNITVIAPVYFLSGAGSATNFSYVDHGDTNPAALNTVLDGSPSVTITGGTVSIKLGTPKSTFLGPITGIVGSGNANPATTKYYVFEEFCTQHHDFELLAKGEGTNTAYLIYVDTNVTLNGSFTEVGQIFTFTNVSLTAGWNYLIIRETSASTSTLTSSKELPSDFKWTVFPGL